MSILQMGQQRAGREITKPELDPATHALQMPKDQQCICEVCVFSSF